MKRTAKREASSGRGRGRGKGKEKKGRTVKQLETRRQNLIASIEKRAARLAKDRTMDFEQLGVDQLFVDEAHLFKNLMFTTKMRNISGLGDGTGSQRAYDMFVKVSQLYQQNGREQGVVFATGTPISNSMAEMYHNMRYLMPETIEHLGFGSFDSWANTFAAVEQAWVQKTSGDGFKSKAKL